MDSVFHLNGNEAVKEGPCHRWYYDGVHRSFPSAFDSCKRDFRCSCDDGVRILKKRGSGGAGPVTDIYIGQCDRRLSPKLLLRGLRCQLDHGRLPYALRALGVFRDEKQHEQYRDRPAYSEMRH